MEANNFTSPPPPPPSKAAAAAAAEEYSGMWSRGLISQVFSAVGRSSGSRKCITG